MSWFAFSLVSVFALALAELTQQYLLNKKAFDEITSAVLTFFFQAVFTIPIIFLLGLQNEFFIVLSPEILPFLIIVGIASSAGVVYYLKGLTVQNISISGILVASSVAVSTTLGILFFAESTNFLKFLGIALVLIAIISLNIKNVQLEKNHAFALLSGVMFGFVFTLDKKIVQTVHPIVYLFWSFFLIAAIVTARHPKKIFRVVKTTKLAEYTPILVSGIGYFLYNFATFTAYSLGGEVGRIDAINNSQVFLIILFEYFILKHTEGLFRKIITAIVALAGVVLLGTT